ncbi:hypothetical protein PIB30_017127 [Stylosanthes scabra]|uniref:PUM-HD domain-containing protein n=1 Tax=Stylosanthes scabra TaxID=79078 RepID=A0ABU6V5Q5_9FABA|nr:hypothetical protein [Stylosanthes scabra]
MEGSVAAVGNMLPVKDHSTTSNSNCLGSSVLKNHMSEGQCQFEPTYAAYCTSIVNLEPRLPPRHLPSQTSSFKDNLGPDTRAIPDEASQSLLEDTSIHGTGQRAVLLSNHHKSLVDLIQFLQKPFQEFSILVETIGRQKTKHTAKIIRLKDNVSTNEFMHTEKQKSRAYKAEARRHKLEEQYYVRNKLNQSFTNGFAYQMPCVVAQVISQGINNSQSYFGSPAHCHAQFSLGIQPSISFTGLTGSLYASPAAFMTPEDPFYPDFQPSGLFTPQNISDGYDMNSSIFLPYIDGYSSQGTLSLPFEIAYYPNPNGQAPTFLSGERVPHTGEFQNQMKFCSQHGLTLQPSYVDSHIQYYPHSFYETYPAVLQQNQLQSSKPTARQTLDANACLDSQKFQPPINGSDLTIPNAVPFLISWKQFLPSSPMCESNPLDGKNEMKEPLASHGNLFCSSPLGFKYFGDSKKQSIIEELKPTSFENFELSDVAGHIIEFSIDQYGSRLIQQKLQSCSAEERAIEVIELDQKIQLVQELDGHLMRCVHDQNGNHVIQKCIECMPIDKIQFIISAFQGQVATLSTHPYGCRVIQRVLEHCSDEQNIQRVVDEILRYACFLAEDQYGNYVIQHVIEKGRENERSQILSKLTGRIVQLSKHKYGSNVFEKCWEHSSEIERDALLEEIIQQPNECGKNLLTMMKDQYANYVVQKVLETRNHKHREVLFSHIRVHLPSLKKYTYGKQVADPGKFS